MNKLEIINKTSYQTILTFLESYCQIILTFSAFMSNNKHFQTVTTNTADYSDQLYQTIFQT